MFMESDRISEIVAHFIGYFDLKVEQLRLRDSYEEFWAKQAKQAETPDHAPIEAPFHQAYALGSFVPGVSYTPPGWTMDGDAPLSMRGPDAPSIEIARPEWMPSAHGLPQGLPLPQLDAGPPSFVGPDPGSVASLVTQVLGLADNDVVIVADLDITIDYHFGATPHFDALVSDALAVGDQFLSDGPVDSTEEVVDFFEQVNQAIAELPESGLPEIEGVTVVVGEDVAGIHVNGEVANTAPKLEDLLPEPLKPEDETTEPEPQQTSGTVVITPDDIESSVTSQSGANLMVNEALLTNSGLSGTFIAVMGDVHELDAIIQTNAYSDMDSVESGFGGGAPTGAGTTASYNVANFAQQVLDAAAASPGVTPSSWTVSVVEGDMVFLDWVSQYGFISDSDVSVLSTTGVETTITSGENLGLNQASFADLGLYYDVIIIGGNLYDGNFICQTNVLYDDDTLELLGAAGSIEGEASTSGNLLWNSANILNVGAGEWQQGVPDCYSDATDAIANGKAMPDSLAADPSFEGFAGLKVLYIKGDVYDLHYINQVNVLGDADHVAVYQEELLAAHPDTEWCIDTGSNALANIASIVDVDSVGDTSYVGGSVYSDAILIQADIINTEPDALCVEGDGLVSEVIAFLDSEGDELLPAESSSAVHVSADGPTADVMQSVLA